LSGWLSPLVKAGAMSARKQSITVFRKYKPAPDDCTRALSLLLQAPLDLQATRGDSHDLMNGSTVEMAKNEPQKTEREKT
jgi:hypothetical protein